MRIEDTDLRRLEPGSEKAIIEDLCWLGLNWDKGPFRQSERLDIYGDYANRLLTSGLAYRCWCSKERLAELKSRQAASGVPPRYDGRCRGIKAGAGPHSIRFMVQGAGGGIPVSFVDAVHGETRFDTTAFGDFIIMGSDGVPSYNFGAVVDDALMGITHIIRGDDHISNTPRQLLLFNALGFETPVFAHIPLVTAPDRTPLGKRDMSASVGALRDEGILPEAVINAAARLGWSCGEELKTLDELAGRFSLTRLSKSPSIFDYNRLKAINRAVMGKMDSMELSGLASLTSGAKGVDNSLLVRIVDAAKANASSLNELKAIAGPLVGEPAFSDDARKTLAEPYAKAVLKAFLAEFEKAKTLDDKHYAVIANRAKAMTSEKGVRLYMPLRCALTGASEGIELVKVVELIGKEKAMERIKKWL